MKVTAMLALMVLIVAGDCTAQDAAARSATAKSAAITNPGLEDNGEGWWVEVGRSRLNSVEWLREGAHEGRTCAKLTYSGKEWLWLNSPPLLDLEPKKEVTLAFRAKWLSGGNVFSVGCNSLNRADRSWGWAHDDLWLGELPKDNKWHELEIKFTTPDFDFRERYLCIKMGPRLDAAAALIDDVRILSVAEPEPVIEEPPDPSRAGVVKFDLPDKVALADFPDVSEVTIDGRRWRAVSLRDVRVRAPAKVTVKTGHHETFPLIVENSAAAKAMVEIASVERMNVYVGEQSLEIGGGAKAEIRLPIQALRAVDFDLVLTVRSGGVEKSLPVRIEPQVTYPVFGLVEHFMRCPPRTRGSFHDPATNAKAEEDMKYLRLLPCQVFRVDGPGCWGTVEGKKGEYFFDAADWHVAATKKFGGSRSVMLLGYEPGWTKPFFNPEEKEKLDHWREYVRALAKRFRDQVDYWEVWNEPCGFWFHRGGKHGEKLYEKDYAEECSPILAAVIRIASEVIRREDPDGKILTPGFVPGAKEPGSEVYRMVEKLFQMGMAEWVDFINLHIYPASSHPIPTTPAQGYKVDGREVVSWEATLRCWRQFDENITTRGLLDLMKEYGISKPLWVTEFGGHPATHERFQGLGILREAAVLVSEGAKGLHYYEFSDYPHEPSRLQLVRHEDKYRTLGLVAYSQAIRYLTGASHEPERCEVSRAGGRSEKEVPCRVFGRGKETIVCVWSNAAQPVEVQIRTRERFASVHISTFSVRGEFLTESKLSPGGEAAGAGARIVSDRQLIVLLHPLQFRILSLQ